MRSNLSCCCNLVIQTKHPSRKIGAVGATTNRKHPTQLGVGSYVRSHYALYRISIHHPCHTRGELSSSVLRLCQEPLGKCGIGGQGVTRLINKTLQRIETAGRKRS